MKRERILLLATFGLLIACAASAWMGWYIGIHSRAISRDEATGLALAHIGGGILRNARLDRSNGNPVWEINFEHPGKRGVTEVTVHALTREVVGVRTESLRKANHDLADVAKHLGITAELLSPKETTLADESAPMGIEVPMPNVPAPDRARIGSERE